MSGAERGTTGLAARLCAARARQGLSQAELSARSGVERKTCSQLEGAEGAGRVGVVTVERLAEALQVSPAWLAFGSRTSAPQHRLPEGEPTRWRYSHRRAGYDPPALPPLEPRFAPVVEALGPSLPYRRRVEVATWLKVLAEPSHDQRGRCTGFLRALLRKGVPAQHQDLVKHTMQLLTSGNGAIRARMALLLIIDAGLPNVDPPISEMQSGVPSEEMQAVIDAAQRLLYMADFLYQELSEGKAPNVKALLNAHAPT